MIYTQQVEQALKLCFAAHKDQVDKGGLPLAKYAQAIRLLEMQ